MVLKGKRGQLVLKTKLTYAATTSARLVVFHVVVFHCPYEKTNTVKYAMLPREHFRPKVIVLVRSISEFNCYVWQISQAIHRSLIQ